MTGKVCWSALCLRWRFLLPVPTSRPSASSGKHAVCLAGVPVGALADLATGGKKSAFLATGSKIEQPGGRPMHLFGLPPDTETSANPGPWEHGAHRAMFGPAPGAPRQAL